MKTLSFVLLITTILLTVGIVYEKGKYIELSDASTELLERYADTAVENAVCDTKDLMINALASYIDCLEAGKECSMEKYNALNVVGTLKNL